MVDVLQAVERADTFVMALCKPTEMTKQEALEYLQTLSERLELSMEALEDEVHQQADKGRSPER